MLLFLGGADCEGLHGSIGGQQLLRLPQAGLLSTGENLQPGLHLGLLSREGGHPLLGRVQVRLGLPTPMPHLPAGVLVLPKPTLQHSGGEGLLPGWCFISRAGCVLRQLPQPGFPMGQFPLKALEPLGVGLLALSLQLLFHPLPLTEDFVGCFHAGHTQLLQLLVQGLGGFLFGLGQRRLVPAGTDAHGHGISHPQLRCPGQL